jgi:nitric oxide reductase subunit C
MLLLVWLSVILLFAFLVAFIVWSLRSDERLPMAHLRAAFFAGVIAFSAVFVAFTWHTVRSIPRTTHTDQLTPAVKAGKLAFQKYVCVECHTILGNGAYYASDLTRTWPRFVERSGGNERTARMTMIAFLEHPPGATRTTRGMPAFAMSREEAESLVDFLRWTSNIDTNGWPPKPLREQPPVVAAVLPARQPPGAKLFAESGCTACHSIGQGPIQGPDLAGVGARYDRDTIIAFIYDPQVVYEREGMSPMNKGYPIMPSLALTPNDATAIADYLIGTRGQS